ncbi:MAG: SGNH/GDSL hydrolase family protein [Vicinamibacteria bacterium]
MTMRHRLAPALVALALTSPSAGAQTFDVYVALGDSLTAGMVSGSLVETHQKNSFPALIAGVAGVQSFQQPTVSEPGIPAELTLVSLTPGPIVAPKSPTPGSPTNLTLPRPYNNLGVPGADSLDILATTGGGFSDLVLRGKGTALQQAAALHPTFITLWIGNNDALDAALQGRAIEGTTLTPIAKFQARYSQIVDAVKATGAKAIAANIPDVDTIPFVTTIPPYVVNPVTQEPVLVDGQKVPLIGPTGSLASNAHVLLTASSLLAQGIGVPKAVGGQGTPLPDSVILDADEVGAIRDHVAGYNAAIQDLCNAAGIPVLDVNAYYRNVATNGFHVGGVTLTADYLTGGIFSYDGVHLTDLGYAVLANEWIAKINLGGASLPLVDLGPFLGVGQSRRQAGPVEFTDEAFRNLVQVFPPLDRR